MEKTYTLSKSTFIRGLQCPKSLFLYKNFPQHRTQPDTTLQRVFQFGKDFEQIFKNQYSEGIPINEKCGFNYSDYPIFTESLLKNNEQIVLFEAGIIYDEILVLTDVLVKEDNNQIHIYEVKNMEKISKVVWQDLAIQYYVCSQALPNLKSFSIVLRGKSGRFRMVNLTKELSKKSMQLHEDIFRLKNVLKNEEIPDVKMGLHCDQPYKCDFKEFCTAQDIKSAASLFPLM